VIKAATKKKMKALTNDLAFGVLGAFEPQDKPPPCSLTFELAGELYSIDLVLVTLSLWRYDHICAFSGTLCRLFFLGTLVWPFCRDHQIQVATSLLIP
jgi:hypothetical protein